MKISVIYTVTLGALVSANKQFDLRSADDNTGKSISEARKGAALMHLQTTTCVPKQMLCSSNFCPLQQGTD